MKKYAIELASPTRSVNTSATQRMSCGFLQKLVMGAAAILLLLLIIPSRAYAGTTYTVQVAKGYLALRTAPAYDERNEIGELYTGDVVTVQDTSNGQYWWVYSPKYGKSGYVNKDYLV